MKYTSVNSRGGADSPPAGLQISRTILNFVKGPIRVQEGPLYHTCTFNLLDHIFSNMNHERLTGVVLLDMKKAFDTVNHNIP